VTALLLTVLVAAGPAGSPLPAGDPWVSLPEEAPPATHWYGWQTLLADLGAITLGVAALSQSDSRSLARPLGVASAALYLGGGPAIHFVHGQAAEGIEDALLRLGAPVAGALIGAATASCPKTGDGSLCGLDRAAIGFVAGVAAAAIVDAAVLAREPAGSQPRVLPAISFFRGRDGQQHPVPALVARF
jgi:hypothetical protein